MKRVAVYSNERWEWVVVDEDHAALLCHHIREWLTGQKIEWALTVSHLRVDNDPCEGFLYAYSKGSQLDWHLQAVVDICAGKEATL